MASTWFYSHAEITFGPYSAQQLKDLATDGQILPMDRIWIEGTEKKVLAKKVKNLFEVVIVGATAPAAVVVPPQEVAAIHTPAEPTPVSPTPAAPETTPEPIAQAATDLTKSKITPPPVRKGFATRPKGAIIVSQDGATVRYRKKCSTCAQEDTSTSRMTIRNGPMREGFFCPNCRKRREVEIFGSIH